MSRICEYVGCFPNRTHTFSISSNSSSSVIPILDLEGFKDALVEEFGEDGIKFDEQNAQGDANTCATIINGFVSSDVDLILANATPALQAAAGWRMISLLWSR